MDSRLFLRKASFVIERFLDLYTQFPTREELIRRVWRESSYDSFGEIMEAFSKALEEGLIFEDGQGRIRLAGHQETPIKKLVYKIQGE